MSSRGRSNTRDEVDKVKYAAHKLRAENRKLRKENSRLKKELNRFTDTDYDEDDEVEIELDDSLSKAIHEELPPNCPKCKAEGYVQVTAGNYRINLCKACGYRKRQEVKK